MTTMELLLDTKSIKTACVSLLLVAAMVTLVAMPAGMFASIAWRDSERNKLIEAYNECLRTMSHRPIDVIESFCSRLKERL